jgi:uncharacterized protein YcbX
MPNEDPGSLGTVVSLWRYPVKSMMGEELNAADLNERGLLGDRAFALIDQEDGKVVSAKNPRKWGQLFDCRASFVTPPADPNDLPEVWVTLPDGSLTWSGQSDLDELLTSTIGRGVRLMSAAPQTPRLEEYWPDVEGRAQRDTVTVERMAAGTFFDAAVVHLLTTATLDRLREAYPRGRFEARRFRPNIVIEPPAGVSGFVESDWIGETLAIGDEVRLRITGPCPRCVMTTLPQGDLPKDPGILRTAVEQNQGHVGVYATVERGGRIRRGDVIVRA